MERLDAVIKLPIYKLASDDGERLVGLPGIYPTRLYMIPICYKMDNGKLVARPAQWEDKTPWVVYCK
jgi:hypothetical protein